MKNSLVIGLLMLAFVITTNKSFSQSNKVIDPAFNLTIQQIILTSDKTLEFDLYLKNLDKKQPFELALLQACILINPAFYEGGEITVSLVEGKSDLNETQKPQAVIFSKETHAIKLPSRTLKPYSKNTGDDKPRGTIISDKGQGTFVCRIKISNTIAFTKAPVNLAFNFSKQPYPTMISRYIEYMNTPLICNEQNCIVKK
ncbi:MAG: hypothetical protein IPH45_10640 [Bacteroidales bacterium]|nr:hypothetical protein [Bacteroidales bacterium]